MVNFLKLTWKVAEGGLSHSHSSNIKVHDYAYSTIIREKTLEKL